MQIDYWNDNNSVKMQQNAFQNLNKLINLKEQELKKFQFTNTKDAGLILEKFIHSILTKLNLEENTEVLSKFINYMAETKSIKISVESIINSINDIQFIAASESKPHLFEGEKRAYCIYGKALSIYRRKTRSKLLDSDNDTRLQLISNIQTTLYQMLQEGNLSFAKNQSREPDDLLMNYEFTDSTIEPVYLGNQVFSPFYPLPTCIIMLMPFKVPKPDTLINFMRGSVTHVYLEQAALINKITQRQLFYKNSMFKGIYFIEEGEVQSTSGRIVARGWVTNGKCRSSGYGWKFKPLPFFKFIAKNQNIWKQFINDLILNEQYPFKISYILNLEEQPVNELLQRRGGKRLVKLPKIGNSSFDYSKMVEIEKVRHYDQKIDNIYQYKRQMLLKKSGGSINNKALFSKDSNDKEAKRRDILIKNSSMSRPILIQKQRSSSTQNILIMSVLKKLQVLTENPKQKAPITHERSNMKIAPIHFFDRSRIQKKKRYNQI